MTAGALHLGFRSAGRASACIGRAIASSLVVDPRTSRAESIVCRAPAHGDAAASAWAACARDAARAR